MGNFRLLVTPDIAEEYIKLKGSYQRERGLRVGEWVSCMVMNGDKHLVMITL